MPQGKPDAEFFDGQSYSFGLERNDEDSGWLLGFSGGIPDEILDTLQVKVVYEDDHIVIIPSEEFYLGSKATLTDRGKRIREISIRKVADHK